MNMDYFARWTPNMAYYLGWIFADGSVHPEKGRHNLSIGCAMEDEDVILGFLAEIGSHHKIHRTPYERKRNAKPFTRVTVCGMRFVDHLAVRGVRPRKSFADFEFPYIPNRLLRHFVRGYFDGDGSLVQTSQGYCKISIVGSPKFIIGLQSAICRQTGLPITPIRRNKVSKRVRIIEWCRKEQVLAFLRYIYRGSRRIYPLLRRKRIAAENLMPSLLDYWNSFAIGRKQGRWRLRIRGQTFYGHNKRELVRKRTQLIGRVDFSPVPH